MLWHNSILKHFFVVIATKITAKLHSIQMIFRAAFCTFSRKKNVTIVICAVYIKGPQSTLIEYYTFLVETLKNYELKAHNSHKLLRQVFEFLM